MAKIYRTTDRIKVDVEGLELTLRPLSIHQKMLIDESSSKSGDRALLKAALNSVKYSLVDLKGAEDTSGNPYVLEFDSDGGLTESCLDDLFNMPISVKLTAVCLNLLNGVSDDFVDPTTGNQIAGVKVLGVSTDSPEKK